MERLVIFVDDLDRLSAAEMVRGLDAIRNFLELPLQEEVGARPIGVVFVISCDEDRVAEALRVKLSRIRFRRSFRIRFLPRLMPVAILTVSFQFRLEIPFFPKQDMRTFALKRLEECRRGGRYTQGQRGTH